MRKTAPLVELDWPKQYRIVPSRYPPIAFFENLVDSDLMEEAFFIESLTNDRLRDQAGDIQMVPPEDRVSGPGSTPVMAAFTHIGKASRFTDGSYGVYYCSRTVETAIRETAFHLGRFLGYTNEPPGNHDMRTYVGKVCKALHDVRGPAYRHLHHPDDYTAPQTLGAELRAAGSWGVVYHSVRHHGGQCIAAFRPRTVSLPVQGPHLQYQWDGRRIAEVYEIRGPVLRL